MKKPIVHENYIEPPFVAISIAASIIALIVTVAVFEIFDKPKYSNEELLDLIKQLARRQGIEITQNPEYTIPKQWTLQERNLQWATPLGQWCTLTPQGVECTLLPKN